MTEAQIAVRIETISFYDDTIPLLVMNDDPADVDALMIPLSELCASMGLSWAAQSERIKRDPLLARFVQTVRARRQGDIERLFTCIGLRYLPGWLFGVTVSRIQDARTQEKVLRYQIEAYDVLWNHYRHAITAPRREANDEAFQASGISYMAHQQALQERAAHAHNHIKAAQLSLVDVVSAGNTAIATLTQKVMEVAGALRNQGHTDGYMQVYRAILARYETASYALLSDSQVADAQQWLEQWKRRIEAGGK